LDTGKGGSMTIYQKLLNIRKSVEYIQKTEKGNQGAMYVDPAVLVKKIRDKMDEHGVLLIPSLTESSIESIADPIKNNQNATSFLFKSGMQFTWIDAETGDKEVVSWFCTGKHLQDPAMAEGTALTYTERYFLLKFFQIPTSKDDPEYFESKTGEKITEEQLIQLREIVESKGYPLKGKTNVDVVLMAYATKRANVPTINDLPQSKFEMAKQAMSEIGEYKSK